MGSCAVEHNHLRLKPKRWCVLISGRGSNLAALLEKSDVNVSLVLSTDESAAGCAKARRAGVPVEIAPRRILTSPKKTGSGTATKTALDWNAIDEMLRARSIDAIFLLGFMRIVPEDFTTKWSGKILNLHPSLLPSYPGLKSIERAVTARDQFGVTIHEVVPEVDAGPLLISRVSGHADEAAFSAGSAIAVAETLVHIDEQRLVKEIVETWRP